MESEVGLGLGDRAPVPHLAGSGRAAGSGPRRAVPAMRWAVGSLGSLSAMLEWMFKVTSMPWERAHCRNDTRVGEQRVVPLPSVPGVGRLPVGVERQRVEGHLVLLEGGIDRVFDIGTGVRGVVRVPHAEDIAGEEGSRAGQLGEGVQRAGVVVAVDEQVAVLDVSAARCRGSTHPLRGPDRAVGVVQQPPSGAGRADRRCATARARSGSGPLVPGVHASTRIVGEGVETTDPAPQGVGLQRRSVQEPSPARPTGCRCPHCSCRPSR